MDRVVDVRAARMCEGMSSGPSDVWVNHACPSGTMRSIQRSRSCRADGSAFSWIVRLADVCRMRTVHRPSVQPASVTTRWTASVTSCSP